jgi:hypothetical protein
VDKSGLSSWNWTVETSRSISSAFKLQIFSGSNTSDTVAQSQHFQITDSATTTTSTSLSPSATTLDGTAGGAGNTNTVSGSGGGLSPGDKAGIGIGVASLIATVIGVVIAWKQYKKKSIE